MSDARCLQLVWPVPVEAALPRLMGTAEVAAYLRVAPSRVRQLRRRPDFPEPVYAHLGAGFLWLAVDVARFDAGWDRTQRPGRPRRRPRS